LAAGATSVLLFVPFPFIHRVPIGVMLALLASPIIARRVFRTRATRRVGAATSVLLFGYCVTPLLALATDPGRVFVWNNWYIEVAALTTFIATFGAVSWCGACNGVRATALILGLGWTAASLLYLSNAEAGNIWKYALAWPVSVLALGIVSKYRMAASIVVAVGLAGYGILHESRNAAGAALAAALLGALLNWRQTRHPVARRMLPVALGAAAATCLVLFGLVHAVTAGVFGQVLQQRQVEQDTVYLLGSRVEPFAVLGYASRAPLGIGPGVSPSAEDRAAGVEALGAAGVPMTAYVDDRLLGERVDPHSVLGSFWLNGGVLGALAGIYLLVLLISRTLSARRDVLMLAFIGVQATWDMLFSSLIENGRWVAFGLALLIVATDGETREAIDAQRRGLLNT